jgi:molybdopterin/thiamine biosynthesis adenylyltransferase/molybdopterin synthase catalytic subunit/rhodanese-related sulfurtransferase
MFEVSGEKIDTLALNASLENHGAGALVVFEGRVRKQNDGRRVDRLEYELFEELCVAEGERIIDEARALFPILEVKAIHRWGLLELGDVAVWVGVLSAHRGAAYQASRFIIDSIKARCPIWKKEYYVDGPTEWVGCPTCESHAVSYDKVFSRQQRLIGQGGQKTLADSRVLIVGAGGLGCPSAQQLTAAGVGYLRICDGDKLDASNLHRQTLFSYHDVGSYKAVLAKRRLEDLHPFTKIDAITQDFTPRNADVLLEGIDLVLDCTDNFAAKYLINDRCVAERIPFVQASIFQNEAQLFSYRPDESACFRCTRPVQPPADCVESCTDAGVLGAGTSIVGSWQAMEAIRVILRQTSVAAHSTIHFDLENADNFSVKRTIDPNCPACGPIPHDFVYETPEQMEVGEADFETLKALNPVWVDIREIHEDGKALNDAIRLPLSSLDRNFFKSERATIVVYCAKGHRSRALLKELRAKGFDHVMALKGGLEEISHHGHKHQH